MRILYWAENFWPLIGGAEVLAAHHVKALVERGHRVVVVTSQASKNQPTYDTFAGADVHRFPFTPALLHRDILGIKAISENLERVVLAEQPELVHLNFSGPSPFFFERLRAKLPPALVTVHVPTTQGFAALELLGRTLRAAQRVVAVSQSQLDDIKSVVPEIAARSSVVLNSLVPLATEPSPRAAGPPVILAIGRLVPEKGFDVALEAFAQVAKTATDATLVIAGDGPARPALQEHAAALGIQERVSFPGWIAPDDVPALMARSTMVVVPSRWREPFGLVALQAAQVGVPCIASAVGGLPEVVVHGETGALVPPEDPIALAHAMRQLFNDADTRALMGAAARARAQRDFGFEQYVERYEDLYRTMIQAPTVAQTRGDLAS